ncbi:MAG TPA: DUF2800 domain-containing protein [Polyangiaceae bacterium]|nr:DUF2800 domain-containing protein [Polyangiaceae bacterium]
MITFSQLQRLLECPGSEALPRAEIASPWADAGHEEHAVLAEQVRMGTLPEKWRKYVPDGSRAELGLAFDVVNRTGRLLGEDLSRAYGVIGPFEIAGAADVVGAISDCVVIGDWKTGYNEVEPAATNAQLAGLALAATRALGMSRAIVRLFYTKTGAMDEAELDALDLAAFADRLEAMHGRVAQQQGAVGDVSTREGSWCRHCPANKNRCASKTALLVQVAQRGLTVIGEQELTAEMARESYSQIVALEQMVKDARSRMNAWVDENGPIELANGKRYGRYQRTGKAKLDADAATTAIAEICGESATDIVRGCVKRTVSQADIERAVKAVAPKGYTKTKARIVARIEELGGLERVPEFPYGEHAADKTAQLSPDDIAEADALLAEAT